MKTERNIMIAFLLNLAFSIFEMIGGLFTNSVAIISDAVHDFGDAISIGLSYFFERKSKKNPDQQYTYGYGRYSVIGAFITTVILFVGSIMVIYHSVFRIFAPVEVHYDGMVIIAVLGFVFNFLAAYFTKDGHSLNQKSVNLHMLEDVFGWLVVLIGSILMKVTNILYIDSIMSLLVSVYILVHAIKNLKSIVALFLEKTPISLEEIKQHLLKINDILDIHHIHIWSLDGINHYATMHVLYNGKNGIQIKKTIREKLIEHQIVHVTIELETEEEQCKDEVCHVEHHEHHHHHH